jgi:hypothetical protein
MTRLADLADIESFLEIDDLYQKIRTNFYQNYKTKKPGSFNKFFRDAGYDAIFDDIDVIYGRTEKQLVILNQNALEDVQFFYNKYPISMSDIKSKTDGWRRIDDKLVPNKILSSEISFKKGKNYFHIKAYSDSESKRNNEISFSLMYSSPSLGYGSGASYNYAKNEWERNSIHRIVDDAKKVLTGEDYRI